MPALSLTNVVTWVAQGTVVVLIVALLARALRLTDPRGRMALWRVLAVLCLALPFAAPGPRASGRAALQPAVAQSTDAAAAGAVLSETAPGAGGLPVSLPHVPASAVFTVLAAGTLLRLAWLALGLRAMSSIRRRARPATDAEAFRWAEAQVGAAADLWVSPEVTQPATFGLRRPVVLVPVAFDEWPMHVRRALAAHELLHVKRRDWGHAILEELLRAGLWFHPAAWWLVDRIRLAREQIVDREVVRLTRDRRGYLEALLDLARASPQLVPVTASAFFRRPHLLDRVQHLTKEVPMARLRFAVSLSAACVAALAVSLTAARAVPLDVPPAATPAVAAGQPLDLQTSRDRLPPAPLMKVPVSYPASAAGLEGPVTLEVSVDAAGLPTNVHPLLGDAQLTAAAVEAVSRWRFEPRGEPSTFLLAVNVRRDAPETAAGVEARRIGKEIGPPSKTFDVRPVYPEEAKDARVQGVVIIEASIDVDGRVSVGRVLRAVDPRLDAAALDAVLRWEFTPSLVDGVPQPVVMTVTVNFLLQ